MLLLLLSLFSRVRVCVTPQTAAHQDPLSIGLSRQEYWSGLPFPSPLMYENVIFYFKKYSQEYFNCNYEMCGICKSLSCVQLSTTPWTAAYHAPPSMGFSRQEYWSVPLPSSVTFYEEDIKFCLRVTSKEMFYCLFILNVIIT